jgi:hypothetical protein
MQFHIYILQCLKHNPQCHDTIISVLKNIIHHERRLTTPAKSPTRQMEQNPHAYPVAWFANMTQRFLYLGHNIPSQEFRSTVEIMADVEMTWRDNCKRWKCTMELFPTPKI